MLGAMISAVFLLVVSYNNNSAHLSALLFGTSTSSPTRTNLAKSGSRGGSKQFKNSDDSWSFTFHRTNYDPLPFFDDDSDDDTMSYAFLADYVSVIEPYVDMELTVYTNDDADYNYKYKVYDTDNVEVAHGSVYPSKGTSGAFSLTCKPYEQYFITVVQYDRYKNRINVLIFLSPPPHDMPPSPPLLAHPFLLPLTLT